MKRDKNRHERTRNNKTTKRRSFNIVTLHNKIRRESQATHARNSGGQTSCGKILTKGHERAAPPKDAQGVRRGRAQMESD
eukprot:scaffold2486_cov114-Isochrysis_galbana.AAC.4